MIKFLAENDRIPKLLLVAVTSGGMARRTPDLTPPSAAEIDNRFSPGNGGADAFLSFLADELIPFVEKTYRTRPYQVLAGHSFGGLFAIHALMAKPKLFNAYIAIDPTVSWNNGAVLAQAESFFSKNKELATDFYMTASNAAGGVPAGVQKLAAMLEEKAPAGFRWSFKWMREETHGSIPLRSIHEGLDTIFDGWHLTDPLELFDKGGMEAIHRHFRDGGRRCGFDRTTPPFTVSLVVAGLMRTGRLEEASKVLLHDPKAYPPPWNQLDALARAYAERGNVEQAIRYYSLSLKENPRNEWAKRKLAEMGVKVE
ncbi:MAG: alpha/beta hydrolase-fold protein [Acidobacteriota bacterium]